VRIEALLDMVGLKAVAGRAVGTYSKGMARRIGLAQALINDPDLVILDEPTTGLDPIGTRQIKDLIIQLAQRGKTILLCSHLLADVEDVCDRIAIMYGGKIQTQGQVKELLQQTNKTQIISQSLSQSAISKIKTIISEDQDCDIEITSPMEKLESFFIRTVEEARRQGKTTSGVVHDSDARLDNFLTQAAAVPGILDKLVAAPLGREKEILPDQELSETKPVGFSAVQPDKDLISKLTGSDGDGEEAKTTVVSKPSESVSLRQEEIEIRTDILDQLTGRQSQENQGDTSNA
jgi:ABC-2 type transport system ATP-binding protein